MSIEWLYRLSDRAILLVLLIVGVATSGASLIVNVSSGRLSDEWWEGWLQNFSTEMFGAFLGFWLLGMIVDKRRQREAKGEAQEALRQRLIREMGSKDNATALNAVDELRVHGWLEDRSLQGASMEWANLQGASLYGANLQKADLLCANLQGASMEWANLQGIVLMGANLQGASLWHANLQGAFLGMVLLSDPSLADAKLRGLQGRTTFDDKTTLPDGTNWTPDTDMTRFTNPEHPEFWRSDNPNSPAYRDDE